MSATRADRPEAEIREYGDDKLGARRACRHRTRGSRPRVGQPWPRSSKSSSIVTTRCLTFSASRSAPLAAPQTKAQSAASPISTATTNWPSVRYSSIASLRDPRIDAPAGGAGPARLESRGIERGARVTSRPLVQRRLRRGRQGELVARQRVLPRGEGEHVRRARPPRVDGERVRIRRHRGAVEPGRDGAVDVGDARATFELTAGEIRGSARQLVVVAEPGGGRAVALAGLDGT